MSLHADLYKNLITLSCLLGEAKKNDDLGSVAFYSYGFNEIAKHLTNVFAVSGVESVKSEFANVLLTLALQGILAEDLYEDLVVKLGYKAAGLKLTSSLPQVTAKSHQIVQPQQHLLPSTPVVQQQLVSRLEGTMKNVNAASVVKSSLIAPPPESGVIDKVEALEIKDFPSRMDFSDLKTASVLPIPHVVAGSDDLDTEAVAEISLEIEAPDTMPISELPPVDDDDDDDVKTIQIKPIRPVDAFDNVSSGLKTEDLNFAFDSSSDLRPFSENPFEPKEKAKAESKGKTEFNDPFADVSSDLDDYDFWSED